MAKIQVFDLLCSRVWALDLPWLEMMVNLSLGEGNAIEAVATRRGERLDGARRVEVREGGVACVPVVGPIFRRANLLRARRLLPAGRAPRAVGPIFRRANLLRGRP